jgi:hypothetical protein
VLASSQEWSPQDFKNQLAGRGLQVVYQVHNDHNQPDLAFIDFQAKTVLTGQTLGLAFPDALLKGRTG